MNWSREKLCRKAKPALDTSRAHRQQVATSNLTAGGIRSSLHPLLTGVRPAGTPSQQKIWHSHNLTFKRSVAVGLPPSWLPKTTASPRHGAGAVAPTWHQDARPPYRRGGAPDSRYISAYVARDTIEEHFLWRHGGLRLHGLLIWRTTLSGSANGS